jgi:hypothetical protein
VCSPCVWHAKTGMPHILTMLDTSSHFRTRQLNIYNSTLSNMHCQNFMHHVNRTWQVHRRAHCRCMLWRNRLCSSALSTLPDTSRPDVASPCWSKPAGPSAALTAQPAYCMWPRTTCSCAVIAVCTSAVLGFSCQGTCRHAMILVSTPTSLEITCHTRVHKCRCAWTEQRNVVSRGQCGHEASAAATERRRARVL